MSAGFDLAVSFGAPSQLSSSTVSSRTLCSALQQSNPSFFPTFSMRCLRPKRTCSGVVCFGGYQLNWLFINLFFLRSPHTQLNHSSVESPFLYSLNFLLFPCSIFY